MGIFTKNDVRHFGGDIGRYQHLINHRVFYTPGVRFVAEKANAHWLIDAIASHIGSPDFNEAAAKDDRSKILHFWKLSVHSNSTAILVAKAESPEEAFIRQDIPSTDFPLDSIDIWAEFDGHDWTLHLPFEH